jgi:acyl dehydratase
MTPTWAQLEVGQQGPVFLDEPLSVKAFVRYAGASGDWSPGHYDTPVAQAHGYPEPIAAGMFGAGVMGTYASDWLGPENVRRFKVQFREAALPRDVITYTGIVMAKRETGGERFVDIEMEATRQTGGVFVLGWATFVVPD